MPYTVFYPSLVEVVYQLTIYAKLFILVSLMMAMRKLSSSEQMITTIYQLMTASIFFITEAQ